MLNKIREVSLLGQLIHLFKLVQINAVGGIIFCQRFGAGFSRIKHNQLRTGTQINRIRRTVITESVVGFQIAVTASL